MPKIVKMTHPEKCDGCKSCEKACSKVQFKNENGGESSAIRIIEKDGAYSMTDCNQCGLCIDVCPTKALSRNKMGTVLLKKSICVGCQSCVGFCPDGVMRTLPPQTEPFKCISCGACVRACPNGAIEMVEVTEEDVKRIVYHGQGPEGVC